MAILKMTKREILLAETVSRDELERAYIGGKCWTAKTWVTGVWCIPPTLERLIEWDPDEEYRGWHDLPEESRNWKRLWQEWIDFLVAEGRKLLNRYDRLERERRVLAEFLEDQNELLIETRGFYRSLEDRARKNLKEAAVLYALAYSLIKQSRKDSCQWKTS